MSRRATIANLWAATLFALAFWRWPTIVGIASGIVLAIVLAAAVAIVIAAGVAVIRENRRDTHRKRG